MTLVVDPVTPSDPEQVGGGRDADPGDVEQSLTDIASASRSEGLLRHLLRTSLIVLAVSVLAMVLLLTVVSGFEYRSAQDRNFNTLRKEIAQQTAPCPGCQGQTPVAVPSGTPIAILAIPSLHLREVVVEGTSSEALTAGPGHLRDTVWPGAAGTSVILGRQAAYGGPFARIHALRPGSTIAVTTGYGQFGFKVLDVRRAHDPEPPAPAAGAGRLTLITASGTPFTPGGVLYVDAQLLGAAKSGPLATVGTVSPSELPMGTDTATIWALAFFLEGLLLVLVVAVWAWRHWGRVQTWIVFVPLLGLVGYYIADQVTRLLPNLL